MADSCPLCQEAGGELLWQGKHCRVIRVDDRDYPGFCRVIWQAHVRETSDLAEDERQYLMAVVFAVERLVRRHFAPDKINLASFGNMVPHLHWHVIPRWQDDRHFPDPIWGKIQREGGMARPEVASAQLAADLTRELADLKMGD